MNIFLDIDGTIVDYQAHAPVSAINAITKARLAGNRILICTGCSLCEIEEHHFTFPWDGIIGGNGAYVEYEGQIIFHKPLTLDQCRHFVDWCRSRDMAYRLECNSGMYISNDYLEKSAVARMKYSTGKVGNAKNAPVNPAFRKMDQLYRDDVNKTAFVLRTYQDYLDAVQEFPDMNVSTWGGVGEKALYGDTYAKGITKGKAIAFLLDYLGETKESTIAFGDAKSDLPMFAACNIAVAMGNGGPECKAAADYITDDINSDGLYKAFAEFHLMG